MAVFTVETMTVCQQLYLNSHPNVSVGDVKFLNPEIICNNVWSQIFGNFPIWEGGSQQELASMILQDHWIDEIGMETVGLWKQRLHIKMIKIMPYYIKLYNAEIAAGNLWETLNLTESLNRDRNLSRSENRSDDKTFIEKENIEFDSSKNDSDSKTIDKTETENINNAKDNTSNFSGNKDNSTTDEEIFTTTRNVSSNGTANNEGNTKGNNSNIETLNQQELQSDTPQNRLEDVIEGNYLTNAQINKTNNSGSSITENTSTSKNIISNTDNTTGTDNKNNIISEKDINTSINVEKVIDTGIKDINNQEKYNDIYIGKENNSTDRNKKNNENSNTNVSLNDIENMQDLIIKSGYSGNKIEMLGKYREVLFNIYELIGKEVSDLWMSILN